MQFYICDIDINHLAHTWTDNIVLPWEDTKLPFFGQLYWQNQPHETKAIFMQWMQF